MEEQLCSKQYGVQFRSKYYSRWQSNIIDQNNFKWCWITNQQDYAKTIFLFKMKAQELQ